MFSFLLYYANLTIAPPDPVEDARITNITSTTVALQWTASYQLHITITGFEVQCSSSFPVSSFGNMTIRGNSTLSATVTGLEEYTRHSCCVSSVTSNRRSPQHCVTGVTLEDGECLAGKILFISTN